MTRGPIRESTTLPDGRVLTIEVDMIDGLIRATLDGEPPPAVMSLDLASVLGDGLTRARTLAGQHRARRAEAAADRRDRKARVAEARKAAEAGKTP